MNWKTTASMRWLEWIVPALLAASSGCATLVDVPAGSVAVAWTTHGMGDKVYREGEYELGYYDKADVFDARSQESEERLNVLAANGLQIVLDTSVRYHIVPEETVKLDQEFGTQYYQTLLGPTLRSQSRRIIGRYQPEEIYSTQREAIERQIREGMDAAIKGRHIVLEAVLIRNVTLPPEIQHAINDKLQAEQEALKQKYLLDIAKQSADRERVEVAARAEQAKITAQGQADATRIAAKATSDSEALIHQNLTPDVLKYQQIQAMDHLAQSPNAKVIMLSDAKAAPLLEVK